MNRRGFIASLTALVAAPFVPTPKVDEYGPIRLCEQVNVPFTWDPPPLAFHPDAFRLVTESLPNRVDVLYGYGCIAPNTQVRILSD